MKSQNTWKLFWGWHHVERGHNVTTLHFFTEGGRITAKKYKPFVAQEVCTSEYLWRIPAERKKEHSSHNERFLQYILDNFMAFARA